MLSLAARWAAAAFPRDSRFLDRHDTEPPGADTAFGGMEIGRKAASSAAFGGNRAAAYVRQVSGKFA
jgi:hypothetical protein